LNVQDGGEKFHLSRRAFLGAPIVATLAGGIQAWVPEALAAPEAGSAADLSPNSAERRRIVISSLRTFEEGFDNGPTTHFDRLDPEDFMRRVRASHAECVVVQTKCMWGYAYYDTKTGVRHPGLNYDLVARMLDAAHSNGLAVVAYYSGQVDVQSALKHPEWVGTNADGTPVWFGEQFPWCCHHTPYGEYAKEMYAEIFAKFDFDALFIDGAPWPRWFGDGICCCPWCEAKYLQQTSESLRLATGDPLVYRRRTQWFQKCSEQYLDEVYAIVRAHRPGLPIWINQCDPLDMATEVLRKSSCLYLEPLASPSGLSTSSILLRGWKTRGPQVGLFWGGYTHDPLEMDLYRTAGILMQGARPRFVTDEQNMPDGRQREAFFDWTGPLMGYVEKVEPLTRDLEPIPCLGILFSETTRDYLRDVRRFRSSMIGGDFLPSLLACMEILSGTQYPVELLPSGDLQAGSLSSFDLAVLPETEALSEKECGALDRYVAGGGKIIATYKPGLIDADCGRRADFGLADALGVHYVEEVSKFAGKDGPGIYLQTNGHPLSSFIGSDEVGILGKGVLPDPSYCTYVRVQGKAESILDYRPPYLVPDLAQHIFHSWTAAPPGNEHVPQAATVNQYGKGTAVYCGVPLFRRYYSDLYWIADWVRGLITRLVPEPPIQIVGAPAIHATFSRQGPKRLIVQLANSLVWVGRGQSSPVRGAEIVGRTDLFQPRTAAILWPEKRPLVVAQAEKWRVRVPEVALHSIVAIELD
jgi:hypothetical protein